MSARNLRLAGASASAFAVALAISNTGAADTVRGTRSDDLKEVADVIDVRLDRGVATLVVRRTFWNGGARHDQAVVQIDHPDDAVAIGLRTLGFVGSERRWFSGELYDAKVAEQRYKELTGVGVSVPMDPAILAWRGPHRLALQVFPIAPKGLKTVEYTLEMPTRYESGMDYFEVPALGTSELPPEIVVRAARAGDKVLVDGVQVADGTRVAHATAALQLVRNVPARIGGALAVVPIGKNRVLSRFRVELARKLSDAPRGARVVVLLDMSRSMNEGDVRAQLRAARAYLGHMPDARVATVPFDREARPAWRGLVPVASALAQLDAIAVTLRNGSHLDRALDAADALLRGEPPGVAKRVLLLTDLRTRDALTPEIARARLAKSGAILHVATVTEGEASLRRDDDDDWAKLAAPTGGVLWRATASDNRATNAPVFEEWARPVRIDALKIVAPGIPDGTIDVPESLAEGEGLTDLRIGATSVADVQVSGKLWSSPINATIEKADDEAKRWAGLVFGTDLFYSLTDKEMGVLARLGRAVSPVTSYLAIEPGVRPSTEGLEDAEGAGGLGLSGFGSGGGGRGCGIALARRPAFDYVGYLKSQLASAWSACNPSGRSATVTVETTGVEIVDVDAAPSGRGAPAENARLSTCIAEATWGLSLPPAFDAYHATYAVSL